MSLVGLVDVAFFAPRVRVGGEVGADLLKRRVCKSDADRLAFARAYEDITGFPIDLDYLARGKTVLFRKNYEIVGGYVVNSSRPLRYEATIPNPEALFSKLPADAPDKTMEVACLYVLPKVLDGVDMRYIYYNMWWDSLFSGKKYAVWGSANAAAARYYQRYSEDWAYRGPSTLPGERKVWIYYTKLLPQLIFQTAAQAREYYTCRLGFSSARDSGVLKGRASRDVKSTLSEAVNIPADPVS